MKIRWLYVVLISSLLFQCAKQTSPTGGPSDETPPTLERSTPKHEQTNVKSSKIELTFDEAIQLNNAREQIIITPTVGKKFETTFNKRTVTLDLKADLQENTTYNINFREAIEDITEKNPATVKLAFSTGSYIDSLSINGRVQDALTEKDQKNYTVALAEASDTFNIFIHAASWITVTNKKGQYALENLKAGPYILYAFEDKNKNLIVDSKSEQYSFLSQQINLTKNIDSVKLRTFKLDINKLKLISARTTFAYFDIRFSKSLIRYSVAPIDSTINVYSSLQPDLTTVKLYNTMSSIDSLQIRVSATDSLNSTVDTLLYMKFPKKEATRDKFVTTVVKTFVNESNSILSSQFKFSKPVSQFYPASTFIEIDSLTRIPLSQGDYAWENNRTQLTLTKKVDLNVLFPPDTSTAESKKSKSPGSPKKASALILTKGAIVSVEMDTAQSFNLPILYIKTESTAIVEIKVQTREDFIVQILTRFGNIVDERKNQKTCIFENLPPDTYQIRMIIDINKNGKWDPGNFAMKTEPEPIVYYRTLKKLKDIPVRANWHINDMLITY